MATGGAVGNLPLLSAHQSTWCLRPSKRPRYHHRANESTQGACAPSHTPLVDAVAERGGRDHEAPFHVPGHKRGAGTPAVLRQLLGDALRYDLTELDGLDYLASPGGAIREAQALAAVAWGAEHTFFLVNGTTVGIHAAVLATCSGPGDALIVARNAHLSAFNAAALAGCTPLYAAAVQRHGMAHNVTPDALETAFAQAERRGLHPRAALIVSPTYFGIISDVAALAEVCHRREAALIVDEAHGAHLRFISELPGTPPSVDGAATAALQAGADIVVQSTHKQLAAMTQGAMLHARGGRVDAARISRALQVLQTSSPSYLVMASLDAARAQAQDGGAVAAAHRAAAHIHSFLVAGARADSRAGLGSTGGGGDARTPPARFKLVLPEMLFKDAARVEEAESMVRWDPWRFTVLVADFGCSGWEAAAELEREWGVVAELATDSAVVFAAGIGTTMRHAKQLTAALQQFEERRRRAAPPKVAGGCAAGGGEVPPTSQRSAERDGVAALGESSSCDDLEVVLTPRQALQAACEVVAAEQAAGRVSAELLCPYPPGVPALYPGERVTEAVVERLRAVLAAGGKVAGAADPTLRTLRVVPDAA